MLRTRACSPPPHSFEHRPHLDHSPITQLIGHSNSLHFFSICNGGHLIPRSLVCVTLRTRVCLPPLQLLEHSCGDQSVTTQSTIFSGDMDPWEKVANSPRTLRSPHRFIMISPTRCLHFASTALNSFFSSRCSRCLSTCVCVASACSPVASPSSVLRSCSRAFHKAISSLIVSSVSLHSFFAATSSAYFSSCLSLTSPQKMAILSFSSPQSGSDMVHLKACLFVGGVTRAGATSGSCDAPTDTGGGPLL
mmetsp:Transcript_6859/g.16364  ORF Transcript_6859/g.16364 Transcript_6859/m.16364 type:complete len:249 (+) Transcript_6859:217-963(+)